MTCIVSSILSCIPFSVWIFVFLYNRIILVVFRHICILTAHSGRTFPKNPITATNLIRKSHEYSSCQQIHLVLESVFCKWFWSFRVGEHLLPFVIVLKQVRKLLPRIVFAHYLLSIFFPFRVQSLILSSSLLALIFIRHIVIWFVSFIRDMFRHIW